MLTEDYPACWKGYHYYHATAGWRGESAYLQDAALSGKLLTSTNVTFGLGGSDFDTKVLFMGYYRNNSRFNILASYLQPQATAPSRPWLHPCTGDRECPLIDLADDAVKSDAASQGVVALPQTGVYCCLSSPVVSPIMPLSSSTKPILASLKASCP